MPKISRLALIAASAAILVTALAAPVSAFTPSSFGTKFRCHYVTLSSSPWEIELRRLQVLPPDLDDWSNAGLTRGWQFIVRRDGVKTYRSKIQWATADANGNFPFSARAVDVAVPPWPGDDYLGAYSYGIIMKIYRPTASGGAKLVAKGALYESRIWIDGERVADEGPSCYGRVRRPADG